MNRLKNTAQRLSESFHDWRHGIETGEFQASLDPARPEWRGCVPTAYRDWWIIERHLYLHLDRGFDSAFIDYGAGLGRACILAATLPYKRVIGIELDRNLASRAQMNAWAARRLCSVPTILYTDARNFAVPRDAATFYFNNPFTGSVLAEVLGAIRASYEDTPRAMQIVCNLPPQSTFETEIRAVSWLEATTEIALSDSRKCLIYRPNAMPSVSVM